jgi:DNA repair ATPase RecN
MKIKSATFKNFKNYDQVSVNFDENITYLIGPNGAGKSTLGLDGPWFVMQGIAEKAQKGVNPIIGERFRFIGEKCAFASGEIVFYDEKTKHEITATRHMTKDAQKLTFFAPPGITLDQQWLNDIFNTFLISPQSFIDLTSKEQAQALNIDTSVYDKKIADLKADMTILSRELKAIGNPTQPEKAERVDVMALQQKKLAELARIKKEQADIDAKNFKIRSEWNDKCNQIIQETDEFNSQQGQREDFIETAEDTLATLVQMGYVGNEVREWINTLSQAEAMKMDDFGDTVYDCPEEPKYLPPADNSAIAAIDLEILNASRTNEKAMAYRAYLETLKKQIDKTKEIDTNKTAQKNAENERVNYLKSCKLPWDNLTIDEEGRLMLDGRPLKKEYWSKGELLKRIPVIIASTMKRDVDEKEFASKLKYVYLEEFNLLDEENQVLVPEYLIKEGFQLVIEYIGKKEIPDKNCIVLQGMQIINPKPVEEEKPEETTKSEPKLLF